jgi:hypothetical protein
MRDPVDTCVSCFTTLFTGTHRIPYGLAELGRYYRGYEALMRHWRQVLPADSILDVPYERLVADLEGEARRIVAYCGLDWQEASLAFHRSKQPVRTASLAQVRRPIYASSIGRWRQYRPWLGPLFQALGIAPDLV